MEHWSSTRRSYFICATPRSGSNFFCEVLRSTGVAGQPDDYFWNPPFWYELWGVADFPSFASRLLCEGSTANGVFGSKLLWDQLNDVVAQFAALHGRTDARPLPALAASFPNLQFIWLTREDKVRQGISYYRALETRRWRSTDVPMDRPADPPFNFDAIDSLVQLSMWEDQAWHDFFQQHALAPHVVTYEDLAQAPMGVARRLLRQLDVSAPAELPSPIWRHQQQADALSEDWYERYRALKPK